MDSAQGHKYIVVRDTPKFTNVHLNQPLTLNALSTQYIMEMLNAAEDSKKPIIFTNEGRAFSVGGDIIAVATKKISARIAFNISGSGLYRLHLFPLEKVALIDGLAMGGGLGIAMACDTRLLTDKTIIGIPETGIGSTPDIGASYFLRRLTSPEIGLYLGLTCQMINGIDSYYAGFSHLYTPELTDNIKDNIFREGTDAIQRISSTPDSQQSEILKNLPLIQQCFDANFDVETMCNKLSGANTKESLDMLRRIRNQCPLSLRVAHECHKRAATMDFYDILNMEYNITVKLAEMKDSNFQIGVIHKVVKKLRGRPNWIPGTIPEVSDRLVHQLFDDMPHQLIEYKL